MPKKDKIFLYDTTLRDGSQTNGVDFSGEDKIQIIGLLDDFGIDYIESGWPGANKIDDDLFANLPKTDFSKIVAFGMTRRLKNLSDNDILAKLVENENSAVCIVGKSWDFHVKYALGISNEENLKIIADSVKYIYSRRKEAIFDAEHFFDGYKNNKEYAVSSIKAAFDNGARWIVLCDTNGGTLPFEIGEIVDEVIKHIPGQNLGIHCHNDTENAVANSLMAVQAGVRQVQGTINGIGERCGNTNLISTIGNLALKMDYEISISDEKLKMLKKISEKFSEIIGIEHNQYAAFTGNCAFAHKGGLHASAVAKNPKSYEHILPELVGNRNRIIISDKSGKANIVARLREFKFFDENNVTDGKITDLVNIIKEKERTGYAFDNADASFEILARKYLYGIPEFFKLVSFKVFGDNDFNKNKYNFEASVNLEIDGVVFSEKSRGNGPVNALDKATRSILCKKYEILSSIELLDYKVKIISSNLGTEATTRVQMEFYDKNIDKKWISIGVSPNIVNASFDALCDSIIFRLLYK